MSSFAALVLLVASLGPAATPSPASAAAPPPTAPQAPMPAEEPERELEFQPGVQVWLRGQARRNPDFSGDAPPFDAVDVLSRVRLSASIRWRMLHAFAQAQDARSWGGQEETTTPPFGMHQGFMELTGKRGDLSGWIRMGRQEVAWGRQRILGPLPWAAQGRSLDAVRIVGTKGIAELELLAAMIDRPRMFTTEDGASVHTRGVTLGAMRFGLKPHEAANVELMALIDRAGPSPTQLGRDRLVADGGVHVFGEPVKKVLTYDVEAHGQLGHWNGAKHRAWALASIVRAQLPKPKAHPGLHLGYAMGSGNACTGEQGTSCSPTRSREFFNFYPTNHPPYGNLDLNDWSNLRDAEAGLFVREDSGFEVSAIYHSFWMNDPRGTWTDSGSRLVAAGWDPTNTASHLGQELDVILTYTPWAPLMIQPGYGFFVPGPAARRLAGNDTQHFVYLWVILTFP